MLQCFIITFQIFHIGLMFFHYEIKSKHVFARTDKKVAKINEVEKYFQKPTIKTTLPECFHSYVNFEEKNVSP